MGATRPELLLVDGATGAGKSTFIRLLAFGWPDDFAIARKLTTRKRRAGEDDAEFEFVDVIPPDEGSIQFSSVGNSYSIPRERIASIVRSGRCCLIVMTESTIRNHLARDYQSRMVFVHRHIDAEALRAILDERESLAAEEIQERITEKEQSLRLYAKHMTEYDFVVLNDGTSEELLLQVETIAVACRRTQSQSVSGSDA